MLTLRLSFPVGRYHATPWGRHVNEGDVKWPPEPLRILRALIATWHRKLDAARHPEHVLASVIDKLAEQPPAYQVPPAIHTHTRHYMPDKGGKRTLVYDAFVRLGSERCVRVGWQDVMLDSNELSLLRETARCMGYVGRAESWVNAEIESGGTWVPNCMPEGDLRHSASEDQSFEIVTLQCTRSPAAYYAWRGEFLSGLDGKSRKTKKGRQLLATVPERFLDSLRVETTALRSAGWSHPPAAVDVRYVRPADTIRPFARSRSRRPRVSRVTTARLALIARPLPRIEDAIRVGESLRVAAMGRARRLLGEDKIPACLTGYGVSKEHPHGHAFYLPEPNAVGRIDHVLVHASMGLDGDAQRVLDSLYLRKVRGFAGQEWRVVLENVTTAEQLAGASTLLSRDREWTTVTPYLHPWFAKPRFGAAEQIRRECSERDLPAIEDLEQLAAVEVVSGRRRRPVHYYRFRSKRGLSQPDRKGSFWRIVFAEPIIGPLALGFGCHFGLGLFRPERGRS